ncbi:hypothetical protein N9C19_00950 [bacterium]|nr:hypothetical protein [bacterium]
MLNKFNMKTQFVLILVFLYMFSSCEGSKDYKTENPTTNKDTNLGNDTTELQLTLNKEYFDKLKADTIESSRDNVKIVTYHYFFKQKSYDEKTLLKELLNKYYDTEREFVITKTDSIELSNHNIEMELSENQHYLFYYQDTVFLDVMRPFTGLNERSDTIIKGRIEKYNSNGGLVLFNWPDNSGKWK